jgi:uncharacterized membrane-anchored protein
MKKVILTALLLVVFAAQWIFPLKMIYDSENVIANGKAYKFRTQPIDPSDPLRGAYITLNYEIQSFKTLEEDWVYGDDVYVSLTEDSLGFARVSAISKNKPANTTNFVVAKTRSYYKGLLNFQLPFNRFYMNEKKAYDAELAYLKVNRDSLPNNSYALVFVKEGKAVLADVLINGTSVAELKQQTENSTE